MRPQIENFISDKLGKIKFSWDPPRLANKTVLCGNDSMNRIGHDKKRLDAVEQVCMGYDLTNAASIAIHE